MSLQPLSKCSSPTDLCDGGVAPASDEVESEWIHATAGFSGGRPISVHRLSNEAASMPLRQAIAELSRVNSDAAARIQDATTALLPNLSQITPAYQIRRAIAKELNVNYENVVLIKGATEVDDSNSDESGPFHYILKLPEEDRSRELMRMIVAGNQPFSERSKESLRKAESQFRLDLLLNRSSTATLPPWQDGYES